MDKSGLLYLSHRLSGANPYKLGWLWRQRKKVKLCNSLKTGFKDPTGVVKILWSQKIVFLIPNSGSKPTNETQYKWKHGGERWIG